jgi:DHA2 family multidrug resistance protein
VPSDRLLLIFAVLAPPVMLMLNSTIVNVSVPVMSGELGATTDQISWVLTSYMVAMSIVLPLTGFLTDRLGRRRFLVLSIGCFVGASFLCGIATSLPQMVLFRILQGVSGAAFVPLSRTLLVEAFPRSEAGRATALWGMGVTVAPIFGPTIGGYLTETFNWRWIFYINLPTGLLAMLLALRYVPTAGRRERSMDWPGLLSLALAVGAFQFVLDSGQREDWFDSDLIIVSTAVAVAAFAAFLVHGLRPKNHPIFDLNIFRDRNFVLGSLTMSATGIGMFGGNFLQPVFLDHVLAYPALTAGTVLMARGVGSLVSMSIAGRLTDRVSAKWVAMPGVLMGVGGSFLMTRYNAQVTPANLAVPLFMQGIGMGLMFVPLSTLAFSTLSMEKAAEASGIYSLIRSVSGAIGVSVTSTFLARTTGAQWAELRGAINPFNPALQSYMQALPLRPLEGDPAGQAMALLARALASQAQLTAFISSFWFITASSPFLGPRGLLWTRRGARRAAPAPAGG